MDSNNNASAFSGAQNTQFSAAQNGNNTKDPLDYYYKDKQSSEGTGFWSAFLFHDQVQDAEMELQYLNATKSDFGGTSVGVSDAKLRFLGIKSYGIIKVSFVSLLLNFIIFSVLFLEAGQLLAFVFSLVCFIHVGFPSYVIYGMKKFTTKTGKFTLKYFQKIKGIWRIFEVSYIGIMAGVYYLSKYDFTTKVAQIQAGIENKVLLKVYTIITEKINFSAFGEMLQVYLFVMLIALLGYIIVSYNTSKRSVVAQEELEFEHNKEIKRPAELARIKMGKL